MDTRQSRRRPQIGLLRLLKDQILSHANAALTPRHRLIVARLVVDDGMGIAGSVQRAVQWGLLCVQRLERSRWEMVTPKPMHRKKT